MRGNKKIIFCILSTLLSLLFSGRAVFAVEEITVTLSTDTVNITTAPGMFASASQTITVSTTNPTGYNGNIKTLGTGTALINQDNNARTIPTFTTQGGAASVPAGNTGYGYGYSIDNGVNYFPVPDPSGEGDRIFSSDQMGTTSHTLTFGLKPPTDTTAGTYRKAFEITVVASGIAPCSTDTICYHGNGDDGTGTMPDQSVSSNSSAILIPSNYSRPGYGFAGWNTKSDGTGTTYGPSQTINTGDLSLLGLELYAVWVAPSGNIQNWTGCSAMSIGDVTALTDLRDGEVYSISKLADGNCWTIEYLRTNPSTASLTKANTNSPTDDFLNKALSSRSTNNFCTANNSTCLDTVQFNSNNINRNLPASYDTNGIYSWYSYGLNYNWYTATAGNGTYSSTGNSVTGDICPAGWHLPTGNNGGEVAALMSALGASGNDTILRRYPNNFIRSGDFNTNITTGRGTQARIWTSTPASQNNAYRLGYNHNTLTYANSYNKWDGFTIRCLAKTNNQSVNGNIHYDSNGGTGTMTDDTNVNLYATAAKLNTFEKTGYVFSHWNTKADDTGISVADGDMVSSAAEGLLPGDTLTLFAVWGEQSTLAYNANGGVDAPDVVTTTGVSSFQFIITSATPKRLDYTLLGWSENPLDTVPQYVAGDTYNTNQTQNTLYAVWGRATCPAGKVCYRANGTNEGTSLDLTPSSGKVELLAYDYSRLGYGFTGWNTAADGSGTQYGPQETITIADDLTQGGKELYAQWVASAGDMQTWNSCSTMQIGDVTALTDSRDGNTYAIAKLADGKCWMIENLRLDPATATIDSTNTNSPANGFDTEAAASSSSNDLCTEDTTECVDQIQYTNNNINRSLEPDPKLNISLNSWYGYGVLYNWYTATAGNGTHSMASGNVSGDICPTGWRLPTGNNGEFNTLNSQVNGGSTSSDTGLKAYPINLIYSGDHNGSTDGDSRGKYTRLWSSTATSVNNAYRFGMQSNRVTPRNSWNKWDAFAVRCIKQ